MLAFALATSSTLADPPPPSPVLTVPESAVFETGAPLVAVSLGEEESTYIEDLIAYVRDVFEGRDDDESRKALELADRLKTTEGIFELDEIVAELDALIPSSRVDYLTDIGFATNLVDGQTWVCPAPGARLSSPFGYRGVIETSEGATSPFHLGVDMAAPNGTPLYSPIDGEVTHVGTGYPGMSGSVVAITGDGYEVALGHMYADGPTVTVGQQVLAGDRVGTVGNAGRSTGPHTHIEVKENGTHIDPSSVLPSCR